MEICTASFPVVFVWMRLYTAYTLTALVDILQAGIRTSIHLQVVSCFSLVFITRDFGVGV